MESALTSKGQVTIPKPMRDHLHLSPGDKVKFSIQPDGAVVILPKVPITALHGILTARKHVSLEQMDREHAETVTVREQKRLRKRT